MKYLGFAIARHAIWLTTTVCLTCNAAFGRSHGLGSALLTFCCVVLPARLFTLLACNAESHYEEAGI